MKSFRNPHTNAFIALLIAASAGVAISDAFLRRPRLDDTAYQNRRHLEHEMKCTPGGLPYLVWTQLSHNPPRAELAIQNWRDGVWRDITGDMAY